MISVRRRRNYVVRHFSLVVPSVCNIHCTVQWETTLLHFHVNPLTSSHPDRHIQSVNVVVLSVRVPDIHGGRVQCPIVHSAFFLGYLSSC